jgi:hypothetical protein
MDLILSTELQQIIELSTDEVITHPLGTLRPHIRDKIYRFFEPFTLRNHVHTSAWLSILSAKKVLPILQAKLKRSKRFKKYEPDHMLQIGEDVLQGKRRISNKTFTNTLNIAYYSSGNTWGYDDLEFPPNSLYAGRAIYSALLSVSGRDPFRELWNTPPTYIGVDGPGKQLRYVDENLFDDDIPDGLIGRIDAAASAAMAYSLPDGLPIWPPVAPDPDKRREFWRWWLTEAIPIAWAQASKQNIPKRDSSKPAK